MTKGGYVYIMANKDRSVIYIGVTNDLCGRIYEHKHHLYRNSFTDKYNVEDCIYYEEFNSIEAAIDRETQLKKWNRQKKEDLIRKLNPELKEIVTDKGFIRKNIPFSQQVDDLMKDLQSKGIIPPFPEKER